ncbi:MAG: IS30 family transposase, partial [Thiobacillus sp.]|nr:IS30 family transposase [Thiobacillus sp.]
ALVTINERQSRYALIRHVPRKTAQGVSDAMISLLTPYAACVHTYCARSPHPLTTDYGKEFAQHERIACELGADFFFAHPYASWERGANENMNGHSAILSEKNVFRFHHSGRDHVRCR